MNNIFSRIQLMDKTSKTIHYYTAQEIAQKFQSSVFNSIEYEWPIDQKIGAFIGSAIEKGGLNCRVIDINPVVHAYLMGQRQCG